MNCLNNKIFSVTRRMYLLTFVLSITILLFTSLTLAPLGINTSANLKTKESDQLTEKLFENNNLTAPPEILRIGIGMGYENVTLDPLIVGGVGYTIRGFLYNSLIDYDVPNNTYVPSLAYDWYMTADAKRWTFILRDDVYFHDGSKLNANSIKFNFDRIINSSHIGYPSDLPEGDRGIAYEIIQNCTIDNPYQITIHLNWGYASFLSIISGYLIVSPLSLGNGTFTPIGTGPYQHNGSSNASFLVLDRFTNYFEGIPPFEKIHFIVFDDFINYEQSIKDHQFDVIPGPLMPWDLEFVTEDPYWQWTKPRLNNIALGVFNYNNPILNNKLVRQALTLVINQTIFIQQYSDGLAESFYLNPLDGVTSNGENSDSYYDIHKANDLLDQAGFLKNPNGIRFELNVIATWIGGYTLGNLEEAFSEVGVLLNDISGGAVIEKLFTGNFDIATIGMAGDWNADMAYDLFGTSSGLNYGNYSNLILDDLLKNHHSTPVKQEQEYYFSNIKQIFLIESVFINLYKFHLPSLIAKSILPYFDGIYDFYQRGKFNYTWQFENDQLKLNQYQFDFNNKHTIKVASDAIYFWRTDAVIESLTHSSLSITTSQYKQLQWALEELDSIGEKIKFLEIKVDRQDLPYYLKFYYNKEDLGVSRFETQPIISQRNEETQSWDILPIEKSDLNLQYISLTLRGDSLLLLSQKIHKSAMAYDLRPLFVALFTISILLSGIYYYKIKRKHGRVKIEYILPDWNTYNLFLPSIKSIVSIIVMDIAVMVGIVIVLDSIII